MTKKALKDDIYLNGIKDGETATLQEIYHNYYPAIQQYIETHQGNKEDAKDVFQEGILLLYQKSKKADFQLTSSFFTYFFAVCKYIWSNKRRKKSFGEVTLTEEITSIVKDVSSDDLFQNEQYTLYRAKFLELGAECRQILSLFFEKVKMAEIVEKMKYSSVSYAKKRKFLCKERLVKLIQNDARYQELKEG